MKSQFTWGLGYLPSCTASLPFGQYYTSWWQEVCMCVCVWTTGPETLCESEMARVEPAASWLSIYILIIILPGRQQQKPNWGTIFWILSSYSFECYKITSTQGVMNTPVPQLGSQHPLFYWLQERRECCLWSGWVPAERRILLAMMQTARGQMSLLHITHARLINQFTSILLSNVNNQKFLWLTSAQSMNKIAQFIAHMWWVEYYVTQ